MVEILNGATRSMDSAGLARLFVTAQRVRELGEILGGDLTTAVGLDAIRGLVGALEALGIHGHRRAQT